MSQIRRDPREEMLIDVKEASTLVVMIARCSDGGDEPPETRYHRDSAGIEQEALSKGSLTTFRTEAVRARAGRDYRTIVRVAERLPRSVLQEDAGPLMRVEEEPEQGKLV